MTPGPELRTSRLVLRRWRDDDREPFAALNSDPAVMEFLPAILTRAQSDAMIDRMEAAFEERGFGFWAVEIAGGEPLIGFVGLSVPRFEAAFMPAVEIGWRLAAVHWGEGYASEAARAALEFGFGVMELDEIVAYTTVRNARSRAVMERIGMTRDVDGDFDYPPLPEGHPIRPQVLYRIARADMRDSED